MPAPATTAALLDLVRKSGIHTRDGLDRKLKGLPDLPTNPTTAAALLVKNGVLTAFQAKLLLAGKHRGFRLGPYVVRDQLGHGGMGAVFLAEHEGLRRKVAIKVLTGGDAGSRELALERFLREARAAAALDHPNIVRIFDVAQQNDLHYLVMEYVDGRTLEKAVSSGTPVAAGRAVEYAAQAAAGLQHAHEKGFIHRDIKPANLMVGRDGVVKILDMGLTRSADPADNLTAVLDHGAVVGTADYIAPEQAVNSPDLDARADIYALGATLYALIAGRTPFAGNTTQKLLQHQTRDVVPLSSLDRTCPPELDAVVAKMMAKNPADRYQTAADVVAALAPWLSDAGRDRAGVSGTGLAGPPLSAVLKPGASDAPGSPASGVMFGGPLSSSLLTGPGSAALPGFSADDSTDRLPTARGRSLLVGVVAAGLLAGAGFAAAVLLLGGKPSDSAAEVPPTHADPDPPPLHPPGEVAPAGVAVADVVADGPPPAPVLPAAPVAPPPRPAGGRVAYDLDLSAQEPFAHRGRNGTPDANGNKPWVVLDATGPGKPPAGWSGRAWHDDTEAEFRADADPGGPFLSHRAVTGPGSAMLFGPEFLAPAGAARVRLAYRSEKPVLVKVRPTRPGNVKAWEVARLPAAADWTEWVRDIDLRGGTAGVLELLPADGAGVAVRGLTVRQAWAPAPPHFAVSFAGVPDFEVSKEGNQRTAGDPERLPPGIGAHCWKPGGWGVFRCEAADGGDKALVVANANDVGSAQLLFDPEKLGWVLTPGRRYRLTAELRTRFDGVGQLIALHRNKSLGSARTRDGPGEWRPVSVVFTAPEDDGPVRFAVDAVAAGERNEVAVRSLAVAEAWWPAGPPEPK